MSVYVVMGMEARPLCMWVSTLTCPASPDFLVAIPSHSAFSSHSPASVASSGAMKISLGLSWCHYVMQLAVLIDESYFLFCDFYSLSLLSAPGIQPSGIN